MASRPETIDPDIALEYLERGRAQFVDARPELVYEDSRERIPGAIHVDPGSGADITDTLLTLPREKLIVAYCDEPNHAASAQVARRVRELGIGDGCFLAGGLTRWKAQGLPTELAETRGGFGDGEGHQGEHLIERRSDGLTLTVSARALDDLFVEVAHGLAGAMGAAGGSSERFGHEIRLHARHDEALLLLWVTELLRWSRDEQQVFRDVQILELSSQRLHAVIRGSGVSVWHVDSKTVMPRDVRIEPRDGGLDAFVLLDLSDTHAEVTGQ